MFAVLLGWWARRSIEVCIIFPIIPTADDAVLCSLRCAVVPLWVGLGDSGQLRDAQAPRSGAVGDETSGLVWVKINLAI